MVLKNEPANKTSIVLAVLPFENHSREDGTAFFCQSFRLDLITELSRFRQFSVIAEESIKKTVDVAGSEPFKQLNTDYHITGAVRGYENILIINAQLHNSRTGHVTWGNRFKGNSSDLFELQETLLLEIVSALQQQLDYDVVSGIRSKPKSSLKAYENWLMGMEFIKNGSPESDIKAREYFQEALKIDPAYSLACSGMSLTYFNEWSCQLWERWDVCKSGAYEWARKAINLDEHNHVAAFVLGRTLLYNGEYPSSEHYLRKALRLSPNDVEALAQIATCFIYLGYPKEAEIIYLRIKKLNPLEDNAYNQMGAFIYFELKSFNQCIELGEKVDRASWADFDAFMAAAWFHLGDLQKMRTHWNIFLNKFSKKITGDTESIEKRALEWMMEINPYKERSPIHDFWEYLSGEKGYSEIQKSTQAETKSNRGIFLKEDEFWQIEYEGKSVLMNEIKGFIDISKLLEDPGKEVHCSELMGGILTDKKEILFDDQAKKQYHNRIAELQHDLEEAEMQNNTAAALKLQKEYDALLEHLSSSLGLNRKTRKTGNSLEKARSAVTWRIRNAIQKIGKVHPALGKHLALSIKTGNFCSYKPEREIHWII